MVVAMSSIGCGWYYASQYRAKLRNQYSLPQEPCSDDPIHFFCCPCALSQEHRELKYRGLDPSLGNQSLFSPLFSNDANSSYKRACRDHNYFTINKLNLGRFLRTYKYSIYLESVKNKLLSRLYSVHLLANMYYNQEYKTKTNIFYYFEKGWQGNIESNKPPFVASSMDRWRISQITASNGMIW